MLSRVACVPRVCLSCRLGILQARAALGGPSLFPLDRWIRRRHHGRDPIIHSKERIEALISGKLVESSKTTGAGKPKGGKKSKKGSRWKKPKGKSKANHHRRNDDEDLPDWGFSFPASRKSGGEKWAHIARQEDRARAPWSPPPSSSSPTPLQFARGEDADVTSTLEKEVRDESPGETAYSIAQEATRQLLLEEDQAAEEDEKTIETTGPVFEEEPITGGPVDEEAAILEPIASGPGFEEPVKVQEPAISPREEEEAEADRKWPSRRRRHAKLGEGLVRATTVGKEALGRPLHALIVKNPNRLRWPPKPIRELAPEQFPQTELDWNDFVPKEEEPSELMDEAVRNLESMRPVDAAPLSMRDFDELRDQLVDGFTYNQLTSYFYRQLRQMGMTRKQLVESLKTEAVRYDWVIEQTKWEASEPDHREKSTPKVDYALMIMQALWKIEVKEQVEGLGRVQLWLQPDVFKLISGPSSSALRTLATQYLYRPNNERIEGSMEESRLDIIARKSIVPVFLARLDEIVSSITSQAVSTEDLNDADLAPGLLQEVARITGSLIEYNEETAELNVTWVANDGLASPQKAGQRDGATYGQTETPAEIALRLLTKQQQKGLPLTLQVISPSQKDTTPPTTYRLMPHQRETRSMSWRERLQSWCRYVSPIGKQPAEDAEPAAPPADGISLPRVSINKTAQPDAAEVLTATFGHILHETPAEQQDGAGAEEAQELAALRNRPRILSPVVPHPAALTPLNIDAAAAEPIAQQTSIVLHFAPSPSQPASAKFQINDSTPSLRLALPIDPDAALSALPLPADATLHAVTPRLAHDVLLPHGVVDVRVAQHAHVALRAADQPLAQLFAACDFDLAEGRLEAPALATFRVPAAWLSTPTGKPSRSKKPVGVRYRFAGLELRQAVEAAWRGHTLVYTSTEAGEHGGQRQELSLRFGPPGHDAAAAGGAPGERERAEFLSLVEGVARGEHFSWHEGFKEVRETAEGDEYIEEPVAEEEEVVVVVEDVVDEVKEAGSAVDEGLDVPFAPETEPAGAVDHEDGGVATQEGGSTAEQPIRSEDESTQALDPAEASPTEDSAPEASSGLEDGLDDAASPALHSRTE